MTVMLPLKSYQRLWTGKSSLEMLEGSIISKMEPARLLVKESE